MEGVTIPDVGSFDVKVDAFTDNSLMSRSRSYQQMPEGSKNKAKIVQFVRELERIVNQQTGFNDADVERVIEGFISNMNGSKLSTSVKRSLDLFGLTFEYQRLR